MTEMHDGNNEFVTAALTILDRLEYADLPPEAVDEAFRLLADRRRRLLLEVVTAYEEELALADAAEQVAEREAGRPVVELSPERVKDVYISLYHDHLPRLLEAGLLEYEQERDLVSPGYL